MWFASVDVEVATEARNALGQSAQRIVVTVADDGVGMPAIEVPPGHFGLRGLSERIARLGGNFNVNRREPHGVCLVAEIPLTGNA